MTSPNFLVLFIARVLTTWMFICSHNIALAQTHPRSEAAFYVQTYGAVLPDDNAQVARTHHIFKRVVAVADKNSKRLPRLIVVNSDNDPWAIALPDGHIILSMQAIRTCYALTEMTEACIAFVLGHELAHLANDDFWHQEVHGFLSTNTRTKKIAEFFRQSKKVEEREMAADDKGYIYAAIAGYPVDSLLGTRDGEPDFFTYWGQQTNTRLASLPSGVHVRTTILRQRLRNIQDKIVFFEFGVRLSHFDYCDDAVFFLKEFLQTYPGREVFNNLGYCYLQMARQAMPAARASFYWMPLQLDGVTRAAVLTHRGAEPFSLLKQKTSARTAGLLDQAIDFLERASKADPAYIPARINLAVAHLYSGRPHQARAILTEARLIAPERSDIQGLEALTIYEQSDAETDLLPTAINRLRRLTKQNNAPAFIFNLARLLDIRTDSRKEALLYWNSLVQELKSLPGPIRHIVCSKQKEMPQQECEKNAETIPAETSWNWPLDVSGLQRVTSSTIQSDLSGWDAQAFNWLEDHLQGQIYYHPDGGAVVLALDEFVQMQVLKGNRLKNIIELSKYCGNTTTQRTLPHGVISSCGDSAVLTREGEVREVWWIAR